MSRAQFHPYDEEEEEIRNQQKKHKEQKMKKRSQLKQLIKSKSTCTHLRTYDAFVTHQACPKRKVNWSKTISPVSTRF